MERYGEFGPYTEREMEVELQYGRNGTQVVTAAASIPPAKADTELEAEVRPVPILYFFSSPNKPGIRLYDQSPTGALADFAGTPGIEEIDGEKIGTFEVPPRSAKDVMWDSRVNIPNKGALERSHDGSVLVFTFIVSEEELESIRRQLREKEPDDRGVVRIVVHGMYSLEEELRFYRELYYSDVLKQRTMSNTELIDDFDKYNNKDSLDGESVKENINKIEDYKNNDNNIIKDNVDYSQITNDKYKENLDDMVKTSPIDEIENDSKSVIPTGVDIDPNANDDKKISDVNLDNYLNKVPKQGETNNFDFDEDLTESEIFNKTPEKNDDNLGFESTINDIDKKEIIDNNMNSYVSSIESTDNINNSIDKSLENYSAPGNTEPIDNNVNLHKDDMNSQINNAPIENDLESTKELSKDELNDLRNFLNDISAADKAKFGDNNINDFDPPGGFGL